MAQARLVIYRSEDGKQNWTPCPLGEVPEWVKEPDTLGKMVEGEMAFNPEAPDYWFAALKCEDDQPHVVITLNSPVLKSAPTTIVPCEE